MEIIKHDKTIGEGVQKTLCYDTPYTVEELEKWRQEFWGKYRLKQKSTFKEYTDKPFACLRISNMAGGRILF